MAREISVGLYTGGCPMLSFSGDYDIVESPGRTLYIPKEPSCRAILSNLLIGKDFHWQRCQKAVLPGSVTVLQKPEEGVSLINTLPVEKYLECVVGSEMNPLAPEESVKAHAIISRSWAYQMIDRNMRLSSEGKIFQDDLIVSWEDSADHSLFDVCSDDHCQRYQGERTVPDIFINAVRLTENLVLKDSDGVVADARYSKCCGGMTERFSSCWQPVDFPYLVIKKDKACDLSDMSPEKRRLFLSRALKDYDSATVDFHTWETDVAKKDVGIFLKEKFNRDIGDILSAVPMGRSASGRIISIRLEGTQGSVTIGKELMVRRLFSGTHLYSSFFEITDLGDSFRLHGKGWGHGVGLCQIGAARMAFDGKDFREILAFYYPDAEIASVI